MSHFFALILRFKKELTFPCRTLKYAFDSDNVSTVTSRSEINDLFHWMKYWYFFHVEISIFYGYLCAM